MLNADAITDMIVAAQGTNADLMNLFPPPTSAYPTPQARLIPYYLEDPGGVNFEQKIQEQAKDTILIGWDGTRTGRFANLEATKHDFKCYVRVTGRVAPYHVAFFDGQCDWSGQQNRFRLLQLDPRLQPVENTGIGRLSALISQGFAIYDAVQITFTITEQGLV